MKTFLEKLWISILTTIIIVLVSYVYIMLVTVEERIDCYNEAKDMELKSEFNFHLIGNNTCIYILPNGKKILSTRYRSMDSE